MGLPALLLWGEEAEFKPINYARASNKRCLT